MPGKEVEKREETVSWTCVWKQRMCTLRDSRIWRILTILRMQTWGGWRIQAKCFRSLWNRDSRVRNVKTDEWRHPLTTFELYIATFYIIIRQNIQPISMKSLLVTLCITLCMYQLYEINITIKCITILGVIPGCMWYLHTCETLKEQINFWRWQAPNNLYKFRNKIQNF